MDAYDRQARLYPAAVVAAPATLFALMLFSLPRWWSGLIGFAVAGGLHLVIVQVVRDLGAAQQPRLWEMWGGTPTIVRLRWATATNKTLHQRRHDDVTAATGIDLPSASEEAKNVAAADEIYEAAATILRERTRNADDFPLVKAEVTHYGFRRNLYGCRPLGIAVASVCVLAEAVLAILGWSDIVSVSAPLMLAACGVSLAWLTGWLKVVTSDFVRRSADRYAEALIGAASNIR